MLERAKRAIRRWLFPEYERTRRTIDRHGSTIQRLDELDVDALIAADDVVAEFSSAVESANAAANERTDAHSTAVGGSVVLFLGDYRECQFEAERVDTVAVYGENHVIANNLFTSATSSPDFDGPDA